MTLSVLRPEREAKGMEMTVSRPSFVGQYLDRIVDLIRCPVIVVDVRQKLVWSNRAAKRQLRKGNVLNVTKGRLRASGMNQTARLHTFLRQVQRGLICDDDELVFCLEDRTGLRKYQIVTVPLFAATAAVGSQAPNYVALFVVDPERALLVPEPVLRSLFDLTCCETRLAEYLLSGCPFEQYADEAGISRNTARTHLKSIFRKTGTNNQATMVTVLSRLGLPIDFVGDDV